VGLLPQKLSRYTAVASLFVKYARSGARFAIHDSDAVGAGRVVPFDRTAPDVDDADDPAPEQLAADLEALGPTFIKLGQLLSTRSDLLPPAYLAALARLQDDVVPFPFAQVQETIEQDLGVRLSKAFSHFEDTPVAAASLGQVHRAALRDGRAVAVKVQRPGIAEQIRLDLEALHEVAQFLDKHSETGRRYNVTAIVNEFAETLLAEMDYRREAMHLRLIGENLAEFPDVFVPAPIEGYTSGRVLTMEYVSGTKVTALSPLTRLDIDATKLAETLVSAYLKQIVLDGVFHADPHPGNVFVTEHGRLALIDLGMVGRISPRMQDRLLKLLLAVSEGRGDEAADVTVSLCEKLETYDEASFRREIATMVGRYSHQSLGNLQVGRVFMELQAACATHGLRAPAELTMLGKTLLNLDQVARALDPAMDVNATIRRDAGALMRRRLQKSATSGGVFSTVLEAKEFTERLPGRVNRVLDALSSSELKLKVELIDEGAVLSGLQKVANRITLGLVLASLIVGAAMMMRVDTPFKILGYPGLAMILFIIAGVGGIWLAVNILTNDHARRHRT
jgi:predicted unusual protein kinase regulating ubiquinone biosynthesis (AarF/ABC1/UbiB family)